MRSSTVTMTAAELDHRLGLRVERSDKDRTVLFVSVGQHHHFVKNSRRRLVTIIHPLAPVARLRKQLRAVRGVRTVDFFPDVPFQLILTQDVTAKPDENAIREVIRQHFARKLPHGQYKM